MEIFEAIAELFLSPILDFFFEDEGSPLLNGDLSRPLSETRQSIYGLD